MCGSLCSQTPSTMRCCEMRRPNAALLSTYLSIRQTVSIITIHVAVFALVSLWAGISQAGRVYMVKVSRPDREKLCEVDSMDLFRSSGEIPFIHVSYMYMCTYRVQDPCGIIGIHLTCGLSSRCCCCRRRRRHIWSMDKNRHRWHKVTRLWSEIIIAWLKWMRIQECLIFWAWPKYWTVVSRVSPQILLWKHSYWIVLS